LSPIEHSICSDSITATVDVMQWRSKGDGHFAPDCDIIYHVPSNLTIPKSSTNLADAPSNIDISAFFAININGTGCQSDG
jgi:hypothetical protein